MFSFQGWVWWGDKSVLYQGLGLGGWAVAQDFINQRAWIQLPLFNLLTALLTSRQSRVQGAKCYRAQSRTDSSVRATCFYTSDWVAQQRGYVWRMSERQVMISSVSVVIMRTPTVPLSIQENGKRTSSVLLPSWHGLFSGRVVCQRKWMDRPLTMQQHISAVEWTSGGETVADSWGDKNSPGDFHIGSFMWKGGWDFFSFFFLFFLSHFIY